MFHYQILLVGLIELFILKAGAQVAVTCSCDLTGNACDANCCCDPDCSSAEVGVFQCSSETFNEDSRLCFNDLVYVNNIESTVQQTSNGVFCIVTQRDSSWNFYIDPQYNITTSEAFNSLQQEYGSYTYDVAYPTTTTTSNYQSGDTIDVQFASNSLFGMLKLPVAGPTGQCIDYNPAAFLNDQTATCARRFSDLASACTAGTVLDPDSYFGSSFQIATTPVNASDTTGVQYITVSTCDGQVPTAITFSSATCQNVPTSVSYTVTYDGTGISSACVSFPTISDITSTQLLQTYSIVYVAAETNPNITEARSGNPGYAVGYPLRTGTIGTNVVTVNTNLLTLLVPNADGSCPTTSSQNQIKFLEDSRTGCVISFGSSPDCSVLDGTARTILNIPSTDVRVASYGNTLTNGSWVEVVQNGASGTGNATSCTDVVVGINYEVLYANTGSLSNPQAEIISVEYSLVTKSVQFECFGGSCSGGAASGATQALEISSSVTFTDVSLLPQPILRVRPTIDARLAADFFYPFTVPGNA